MVDFEVCNSFSKETLCFSSFFGFEGRRSFDSFADLFGEVVELIDG